jgi:hypothetical protein
MSDFESSTNHRAAGDQYYDSQALADDAQIGSELEVLGGHKMDQEPARRMHKRLLEWFYRERERQSVNRMEMAMDADFYDSIQWKPEDAEDLVSRGQMPLVYNEVAPMVDWLIGTERRSRVDWKILPRAEDDVQLADIKTKVMKYVSDVNRSPFVRSRAFADAVKAGIGWVDDGCRDDPTEDILYSKYEDWRRVLYDSDSYELDLSDARYVFRWRLVDEDIALLICPDREAQIRRAVQNGNVGHDSNWEEATWDGENASVSQNTGQLFASGTGQTIDTTRRQCRIIEAQYRVPVMTKLIASGPLKGVVLHEGDQVLHQALGKLGGTVVDKVMMRVHVALFTESDMLSMGQSIYRHNRFSLTPIWCYRRGRDRAAYGAIRRVRDVQQDLNKRASKALFMLNTNQVIADEGAVDDWNVLRDEVDRPDGLIIKKPGKDLVIRRDTDGATGQIQMMTLDAQSIQKSAGVAQENMGRQSNAVSGEAIKARQTQGSVVTTEPFDNLRLATQIQGENQLSLVEQFYTEAKVIRLTGAKGALDWVKVNQPEEQMDGSTRYVNDITSSMADFVVSEQDYAGTMRQVMFESLNQMASRLPPEVSLRMLTIAMEFSDLPNKEEIAEQIRKITGERDPNKEPTPEEQQQQEQQMQEQQQALEMQREQARGAMAEQAARVREINAKAAKLESEVTSAGQGGMPPEVQQAITQIQEQATTQIEQLSKELTKAQSELANRTMSINKDADVKLELGRIDADSRIRVAEIQAASDKKLEPLERRLDELSRKALGGDKAKPVASMAD